MGSGLTFLQSSALWFSTTFRPYELVQKFLLRLDVEWDIDDPPVQVLGHREVPLFIWLKGWKAHELPS